MSLGSRRLVLHNAADAVGRESALFLATLLAVSTLEVSAFELGLLNAVETIGFLLFGVPAGYIADRYSARGTLPLAVGLKAAATGGLVAGVASDRLDFNFLIAAILILGAGTTLAEAAQMSTIPKVTTTETQISKVASRLAAVDSASTVVVPGIVGATLVLIGMTQMLVVATAVLVCAMLIAATLPNTSEGSQSVSEPSETPKVRRGLYQALVGFEVLREVRLLRLLTAASAASNFGLALMASVEAIYLLRLLDFSASTYGLMVTLGGIGGLVGSTLSTRVVEPEKQRSAVVSAVRIQVGLAVLLVVAQYLSYEAAIVAVGVQSLFWGYFVVRSNVIQVGWSVRVIPGETLGRTAAARRTITYGIVPVGSIVGGSVATLAGVNVAFYLWILFLVVAAFIVQRIPLAP